MLRSAQVDLAQVVQDAHGQPRLVGDRLGRLQRAPQRAGVDGVDPLAGEAAGQPAGLLEADAAQGRVVVRALVLAAVPLGLGVADEVQARRLAADEQEIAEVVGDGLAAGLASRTGCYLFHQRHHMPAARAWAILGAAMETGVSYFSSRTLRHVRDDLQEMVDQGCSYVVHCYTETDLAYYRDTMRDVVAGQPRRRPGGVAGPLGRRRHLLRRDVHPLPAGPPGDVAGALGRAARGRGLPQPPGDAGVPARLDRRLRGGGRRRPVLGRAALLRRAVAGRPLRRLGLPLRGLPGALPRALRRRHAARVHGRGAAPSASRRCSTC